MKLYLIFLILSTNLFSQNRKVEKLDEANIKSLLLKPILEAKQTWPRAKERFINGLRSNEELNVICFVNSVENKRVQTSIKVIDIHNDSILGKINMQSEDLKLWEPVQILENDLIDWSIINIQYEDSTVDGNFSSKFLLDPPTPEEINFVILDNWRTAKARFLNGLKVNERLEVTAKRKSQADTIIYIAVFVQSINGTRIIGKVSENVDKFQIGEFVEVLDEEIIDWNYYPDDPRPQKWNR